MIALGADHAGYDYKEKIKDLLTSMGWEFRDYGTDSIASTDYPDYAHKVAEAVASGEAGYGILVCGTGIGMSIVANKHNGIRAGNVESAEGARMAVPCTMSFEPTTVPDAAASCANASSGSIRPAPRSTASVPCRRAPTDRIAARDLSPASTVSSRSAAVRT